MTQHFVYSELAGGLIEVSAREAAQYRATRDAHHAFACAERHASNRRLHAQLLPSAAHVDEVAGGLEQAAGREPLNAQGVTR
jgi:hypothetical protein